MTVLGVVLAAGAGRRFADSGGAGAKQLAMVDGETMVARALGAAIAGGLEEVAVVTGAVELGAAVPDGVTIIRNPRWADGLATSLQEALEHARAGGHQAVVVGLADQPGVTAQAWSAVASAPDHPPIAVATYGGRRGNPVRLAAEVWPLLPTTGDDGARTLMARRPDLLREVPCSGDPRDVDTVEDLDRWS